MKKTARNLLLIVVAVLLLASFTGCREETPVSTGTLQVNTIKIMPYAYMGEAFDLRDVILMEEGVEYSAIACYIDLDTMTEYSLEVNDLCFTPVAVRETVVIVTAKRGSETASKVIYIPTTIRAEPLDDLYKSSGILGGSDPGISKDVNIDPMYLQGENSTTSLHVSFNSADPHPYGNIFMSFSAPEAQQYFTDKVWDNAIVTFWVYNPSELPVEFQLRVVDETAGTNLDWQTVDGPHKQRVEPGQWTQVFFSLRKLGTTNILTKGKYNNDMLSLKFRYDGYSTTEAYSFDFYMDNIDVVPASMYPEVDTKFVLSNETIDQGWENMRMDTGWQGVYTEYDYEFMQGEGSTCSLKAYFNSEKSLTNSFICLNPESQFDENPDMTGGTLHGYFKFEGLDPKVSVDIINNRWETSNRVDMKLQAVGDGWYYGTLNLEDIQVGTGRNDEIVRIRLHFAGVTNDSVVYVDTLKFDYKYVEKVLEYADVDLINMSMDTGSYYCNLQYSFVTSPIIGSNTVRSLKLVAPANQDGRFTWNTDNAAKKGELSAVPNMSYGTLGAWFYFGKQLPNANFQVTSDNWKGSVSIPFVFTKNNGDGWYYGELHGSDIKFVEEANAKATIRWTLIIPAGYTVNVDNLNWNTSFENALVAAEIDPSVLYDGGDLLAGTDKIVFDKRHWENIDNTDDFDNDGIIDPDLFKGLTCGVDTENVYGEYSVRSWYFKAEASNNFANAVAQLQLAKGYDMSGKNLAFDIKIDTDSKVQQTIGIRLQSAGWRNINEQNAVVKVNPGDWRTVVVDFSDVLLENADVANLGFISFYFDFAANTGKDRVIYIDNVRLTTDAATGNEEPLPLGPEDQFDGGDMLANTNTVIYDKTHWDNIENSDDDHDGEIDADKTSGLTTGVNTDASKLYGQYSVRNWYFKAVASNNFGAAVAQLQLAQSYDMTGKNLAFDILVDTECKFQQPIGIRLNNSAWKNINEQNVIVKVNPGEWKHIVVSFDDVLMEGVDITTLGFISFYFDFAATTGYDRTIYIDNVTLTTDAPTAMEAPLVKEDNAENDWTNMVQDKGDYYCNVESEIRTDKVKGELSTKALYVKAPADAAGKLTFNTDYAVVKGELSKLPNMNAGTLGAWFYFGDAEPSATLQITESFGWKGSVGTPFIFGEADDGWYYGTVDCSTIAYSETSNPGYAIRVTIGVPAGFDGYIDSMTFTPGEIADPIEPETTEPVVLEEDPDDLLSAATGIAYNKDHWVEANGLSVSQDKQNVFGTKSTRSWAFKATAAANLPDAVAQFSLGQSYDMTGKNLAFDIKIVTESKQQQKIGIRLHKSSWGNLNDFNKIVKLNPGDWKSVVVNFDDVLNEGADYSDLSFISFYFDYASNTGNARTIYIDNVRLTTDAATGNDVPLIKEENAQNDWTNMVQDKGDYYCNVESELKTDKVKGQDSTQSLYVKAPVAVSQPSGSVELFDDGDMLAYTNTIAYNLSHWDSIEKGNSVYEKPVIEDVPGKLTFNISYAVDKGDLDKLPNMNAGVLGAWFYFGDNEPSASIKVTESFGWKGSNEVSFVFGEGEDGWYYGTVDCANINYDETASAGYAIRLTIILPVGFEGYIDSMTFEPGDVADPVPPTTTPETSVPEVTTPATTVPDAISTEPTEIETTEPTTTGLSCGVSTEILCGQKSVRSWYFKASADSNLANAVAQLQFAEKYDITGKNLAFDIKIDTDSKVQQTIGLRLHKSSWGNLNDVNVNVKLNPGDWRTVVVDFSDVLLEGAATDDLSFISFYFDFAANTGKDRTIYIDNVRLTTDAATADDEPLPLGPEDQFDGGDMLANTNKLIYDKTHWDNVENSDDDHDGEIDADKTNGLTTGVNTDASKLYGQYSVRNWYFKAVASNNFCAAAAQMQLGQSYDLTGKNLAFDILVDTECKFQQPIGIRLNNSEWKNINEQNVIVKVNPGQWKHVVVSFDDVIMDGVDITTLSFISFYFDFAATTGYDRTIYIDNVTLTTDAPTAEEAPLVKEDNAENDWTNMVQDKGDYYCNVESSITTEMKKGEISTKSLYVKAPADIAGKITFNSDYAVTKGELTELPNMNAGVLGTWFYFGDNEPSATVQITESFGWKGSEPVAFAFGEGEDGWYYGTVDCSAIEYSETSNPGYAIRITIGVPAGFEGYIDSMTFVPGEVEAPTEPETTEPVTTEPPVEDPDDLLGACTNIVYNKDHWVEANGLYIGRDTANVCGDGSTRSWAFKASASANLPAAVAQFDLDQAYDISGMNLAFDVKIVSDSKMQQKIGLRLHNNRWGNLNDVNVNVKLNPGEWRTVVVDFTDVLLATADTADLCFISFYFDFATNTGKDRTIYIDNVRLTTDAATADDEPLPLGPEDQFDGGDMLANTNKLIYDKTHWDNVENSDDDHDGEIDADKTSGLTTGVNTDASKLYGQYSVRNWYFKAVASNSFGSAAAQMQLGQSYDLTGKNLAFDILVDTECKFQQPIGIRLNNSAWKNINEQNVIVKVNPGEWKHVVVSFDDVILDDVDITTLSFISFYFDFAATTGYDRTIYIDNVTLSTDAPTAEEAPLVKEDNAENDWTNMVQDKGDYYCNVESVITTENKKGESSAKSLYVKAPADAAGKITFNTDYAVTKGEITELPNLYAGTLGAWFYFGENEPAAKLVVTEKGWKASYPMDFVFGEGEDGWYYGAIEGSNVVFTETKEPGLPIRLTIELPAGFEGYIDSMTLSPAETVEDDWIKLMIDSGESNVQRDYDRSVLKAENSIQSLRVTAPADVQGKLVLNTQYSFGQNYDMSAGKLGAWFYFGEQEIADIYLQLNGNHKLSIPVKFEFEAGADGWHYGTVDLYDIAYAEEGGTSTIALRLYIIIPAGYSICVDGLNFDPDAKTEGSENATDLLGTAAVDAAEWTESNGLTVKKDAVNTYGDTSMNSWCFSASAASNIPASAKFTFADSVDMRGKYLVFDAKSLAEQTVMLQLWNQDATAAVTYVVNASITAGDWNTYILDMESSLMANTDLSAVGAISFSFDFAVNPGAERTVNIDNVRLIDAESAVQDWIHIEQITNDGFKTAETGLSSKFVKAENSVVSLKVQAPADADGKFTLRIAEGMKHRGTLSAWFYFGEQTPDASIITVESGENISSPAAFTFGEAVDGWYLGTVDLYSMQYADGVNRALINKITVTIPAAYTVYVDGMAFADVTETAADDLINLEKVVYGSCEFALDTQFVKDDNSLHSLSMTSTGGVDFQFENAMDLSNGVLSCWLYYEEGLDDGSIMVEFYQGDTRQNRLTMDMAATPDQNGWYQATLDLTGQLDLSAVDYIRIRPRNQDVNMDYLLFEVNETAG